MPLSDEMFARKLRRGGFAIAQPPIYGLIFPANGAAGSDIRIVWSGSNLLPRTAHTAIWRANYIQQTGYYAVAWHSPNDGTWDFGSYSYGTHPYPCDGGVNSSGAATGGTGAAGTVHYMEIAGVGGAFDSIASSDTPGPQSTFLVEKGRWYVQARTCELVSGGTIARHTFWPDLEFFPELFIRQDLAVGSVGSGGASPAFYLGASDWAFGGDTNSESPRCALRGIRLFNAALVADDILLEAASQSDSPQSSAGSASIWYSNINPTPTDVTDKSTAGHSPAWANANRPNLYTG